jgi:diguanylate cyclase (GGDEF)-like protein
MEHPGPRKHGVRTFCFRIAAMIAFAFSSGDNMAEITQLQQIAPIGDGTRGGRERERAPAVRRRPEARSERAIRDAASVMGIPRAELTPRVVEALALILHEMDRIRWELEIGHEHAAHLHRLSDAHSALPVMNRRAFMREVTKMMQHAEATGTPSTLVYIDIVNLGRIKRELGFAARDEFLLQVAGILAKSLREIDLIAELGGGDFGIILNLADEQAARDKAGTIANQLRTGNFDWQGKAGHLEIEWGVGALGELGDATATITAVERRARRSAKNGAPEY